jgi:hypothetical protein
VSRQFDPCVPAVDANPRRCPSNDPVQIRSCQTLPGAERKCGPVVAPSSLK